MADDDIDVEGDFNFKLETGGGLYDANELPSKSANLLPEFTNPPWMLEQGWSLDNGMDEKSKATIEKMLLEEQQYINGRNKGKYLGINKSVLLITAPSQAPTHQEPAVSKRQWTEEEKKLFAQGLERFGHSWTKISQLIPSRTTIQVKNYAKQFFKIQAKGKALTVQGASFPTSSMSSASASASHDAGASASLDATPASTSSFADWESVVSTARPTVISRTRPATKARPRSTKKKKLGRRDSKRQAVSLMGDCSTQAVTVVPVEGSSLFDGNSDGYGLNGYVSSFLESDLDIGQVGYEETVVETLAHQPSTSALNASMVVERTSDSESEVDVDIENEDEDDENPILQNRSASPSSVYNKLLEQAKVHGAKTSRDTTPPHDPHVACDNEADRPSGPTPDDVGEGDLNRHTEEEGGGAGLSDATVTASRDCSMQEEGEGEAPGGEEEEQEVEEQLEILEEKHIVNGVTASSGEVFEFPIPIEDRELQRDGITDEEKMVHAEFFDGRPLKTPERYLKIRNYILDCWKKTGPVYLNKTSVRPGLKNCGDVNCIGRIHAYLECIGAINFGCEQASYNNPGRGTTTVPRLRHIGKDHHTVMSAAKQDAMRPRKRRIRDASGVWVDEKELEGKTIEHKPDDDDLSRPKSGRNRKLVYDPFKLVPCEPFTEDKQAPFRLEVLSTALAVMDIHAHISRTEVIGMLGGQFDPDSPCLTINMAVPCKSISTGMQCEMDPVSQTHASEQIEDVGMRVVGWYHSHPTFAPNPSVRDIETQQKFQDWFAKGGSHFVGLIISPYSPHNASVVSDIRCLTIGEEVAKEYLCNTPYQFSYSVVYRDNMREILGPASDLAEKYANYGSRVGLSCVYKSSLGITCLSKMLQSVKHRLEPPPPPLLAEGTLDHYHHQQQQQDSQRKVDDILHWLEQIFLDKFSSSSPSSSFSSAEASVADVKIIPTATAVPLSDDDVQV